MTILNKTDQANYTVVVSLMKAIYGSPTWCPKVILIDFEKALWNTFTMCFPEAQLVGCWFHFTQAISAWLKANQESKWLKQNQIQFQIYSNIWFFFIQIGISLELRRAIIIDLKNMATQLSKEKFEACLQAFLKKYKKNCPALHDYFTSK